MFNNFWWSSRGKGRKGINWLAWDKISMSKKQGGLGFRNLYGFKVALRGKHCLNFVHNTNTLVSRVYKAKYFQNSNILPARKPRDCSFIWTGIWAAKEALSSGFMWVVGDENDIVAVKDPWIRMKNDFRVDQNHSYEDRNAVVSSFFYPNSIQWDVMKVQQHFLEEDAKAILETCVPQYNTRDRVVWANSTDGIYFAKAGYRH